MPRLALDDAAWTNAWRTRSTVEKALLALGLLTVAVTARRPAVCGATLLVAVVAAVVGARVPVATYVRALLAPLSFVALGAASVAVTIGSDVGPARWSWGQFVMTDATIARAVEVSARSTAAMAALTLLATTTPVVDLLGGLRRLRVPDVVIDIAGLVYRMLFTLLDTVATAREAQAARLGYASGRAARRSIGMLGAAVLARAWSRAHRLEAGLAGRGGSSSLRTLPPERPVSWPFVGASALVLGALGALSVGVPG